MTSKPHRGSEYPDDFGAERPPGNGMEALERQREGSSEGSADIEKPSSAPNQHKVLARGQRLLEVGPYARVVDARAVEGAVHLELAHKGTDDDAFALVVPLENIHFWDEEEDV